MARLSKQQAKLHEQAVTLTQKETLTEDEQAFVLDHFQESAVHLNGLAGAFFTPSGLARDFACEVTGKKILDLCAGIGRLSWAVQNHYDRLRLDLTCVEINADYVAVGKKILPQARWICGDLFDVVKTLDRDYDCVIANPPFGRVKTAGKAPRYRGSDFEYKLIDLASDLAKDGVFIIPQLSAPFRYSGECCYREEKEERYIKFESETGIKLSPNCGMDTTTYCEDWHGVSPKVEIVLADFREVQAARQAPPVLPQQQESTLFGEEAA